jgi:ParB/RepB/Spo0J family partition protein
MSIEILNPALLHTAPDNPNRMEEATYTALVENIRKEGFLQPVLVARDPAAPSDGYEIIDGHHRVRAAIELGYDSIPCVVENFDPQTAAALRLGMNRLRGELDLSAAARILANLEKEGWDKVDLAITGYSPGEISDLLSAVAHTGEDVMPEAIESPPEPDPEPNEPAVLEIAFPSKEEMKLMRAALKKASKEAGNKGNLAAGLRLLVELWNGT